jgi:RNA polymerase sigma-70 factor (ECF subfamily)
LATPFFPEAWAVPVPARADKQKKTQRQPGWWCSTAAMMSAAEPVMLYPAPADAALGDLDDDSLMDLARSGRTAAFELLVRRHQRAVRNVCARLCAQPDLADDLAQEVFVAAWQARDAYESRGRLLAYLLTIAVNRAKNAVRTRARRPETTEVEPMPSNDASPFDALRQAEQRQRLNACLAKLPNEQRQVLALKFGADLDYARIGEIVGCPEATARSRAFLAMAQLRRLVGKWGSL